MLCLYFLFLPPFFIDVLFKSRTVAEEEEFSPLPAIVITAAHPCLDAGTINAASIFIILNKAWKSHLSVSGKADQVVWSHRSRL